MTIKYSLKKLVFYILSISLFSLLNFGKYMECYLHQWSKRLSQIIFFLVVMSLMVVMAIQIYLSALKLDSKPTGSSVEFKDLNTVINMSLTACKIDYDVSDKAGQIQPLLQVISKYRDEFIYEFISDVYSSSVGAFYWFDNDLMHVCKTINLHQVEEIKIFHSYGLKGPDPKNMLVYVHETGLFGSGYDIKFQTEWYGGNTVVFMDLEQIVNLPDPIVCNPNYLFDQCKQRYILDMFKAKTGCSFKLQRYFKQLIIVFLKIITLTFVHI